MLSAYSMGESLDSFSDFFAELVEKHFYHPKIADVVFNMFKNVVQQFPGIFREAVSKIVIVSNSKIL